MSYEISGVSEGFPISQETRFEETDAKKGHLNPKGDHRALVLFNLGSTTACRLWLPLLVEAYRSYLIPRTATNFSLYHLHK